MQTSANQAAFKQAARSLLCVKATRDPHDLKYPVAAFKDMGLANPNGAPTFWRRLHALRYRERRLASFTDAERRCSRTLRHQKPRGTTWHIPGPLLVSRQPDGHRAAVPRASGPWPPGSSFLISTPCGDHLVIPTPTILVTSLKVTVPPNPDDFPRDMAFPKQPDKNQRDRPSYKPG